MSEYHIRNTSQLTRANGALVDTVTSPRTDERPAPAGVGPDDGTGMITMQHMNLSTDTTLGNVPGSKENLGKAQTPQGKEYHLNSKP